MPMNGGTRMLRARRKDINVKPNRRLDRKSSRGMLFENEELRMRTITINAEVEQGQHALKKLRRENEQLRREMWSLRDEYDKMEKLLRKKETDEDSDQENSDSDDNYSQMEDTDEEKQEEKEGNREREEMQPAESMEAAQTATKFGNLTTGRAFDGLSVIDEQTEETTTQTTESAIGYGATSRGNSANRTLNQVNPAGIRMYEEPPCGGGGEFPAFYDPPFPPKMIPRKKGGYAAYENDPGFVTYATGWPDNGYDVRPASPYPYPESVQPSYQKRLEVLQNLPVMSRLPTARIDDGRWMFPNKPSYDLFPREAGTFVEGSFASDKSATNPISMQTPQVPQDLEYSVIQDRAGPDVFISDVCAKKSVAECAVGKGEAALEGRRTEDVIKDVEAEIDKIEISDKPEGTAKTATIASQIQSGDSCRTKEGLPGAKLTTAKSVDKGGVDQFGAVEDSVPCQNPNHKDVQSTNEAEDMAKASKFQSQLIVTLKTPTAKTDTRTLKRVPPVQVPRTYQTLGYGGKSEYQGIGKRYVGYPECRYTAVAACRLANGVVNAPPPPPPSVLPGVATTPAAKVDAAALDPEDIPVQHMQDGLGLLTNADAVAAIGVPPMKPIKIPPAPPPRTTSCLGTIIPEPAIAATPIHTRAFRRAKSPVLGHQEPLEATEHYPESFVHNPLMLSEPMATSSPRFFHRGHNLSLDNLSTHHRAMAAAANDESSTEDISTRKTRTTGRGGRYEPPHLNKSVSSPSFGTFLRRKASEHSVSSMENGTTSLSHHGVGLTDRKIRGGNPQNNVSVSSSSGLDSPTKSDRRKRRVSIKFNKKTHSEDADERGGDSGAATGMHNAKTRGKAKSRNEETDVTTSERERTNSVSSRASSGIAGSGRRKFSVSSNRTYVNDEKIPWCGCWGNGCV